ncbi:lysylphosphatidylglycerol synthase transmembrane domain-containing protein [Aneurinibacillus aneurinilyticus]|uniref:Phosphatidylglycerol lysyltransferase n=1 Tax=Aneurinibacillus aneurinilyticus TaxID=1391 RepID=A0A848CX02_ANEAE|nr:lysylphosphatidylglycerol synthase transmembrane domain-containing protein [Aneurinibacillus aneurinilyticus]NME97760.1 flippase-like domain-containing protein [Aneurinibacillus aneurinilyticus]
MKKIGIWAIRTLLLGTFLVLTVYVFDWRLMLEQGNTLLMHPGWLVWMSGMYLGAFALRAWAWRVYLQRRVSYMNCLYGLFYSLFLNHILPIKAGDAVRIGYIAKRDAIAWGEAAHSVVVLRLLDMLVLGGMTAAGILALGLSLSTLFFWLVLAGVAIAGSFIYIVLRTKKHSFWKKHLYLLRNGFAGLDGILVVSATLASWLLEAWIVVGVLRTLRMDLPFLSGVWVNSMTIAGQVFHFTPGGIGTYESVMSFSLATLGIDWRQAYLISLLSHGFKFAFSYVIGIWTLAFAPLSFREIRSWIQGKNKKCND